MDLGGNAEERVLSDYVGEWDGYAEGWNFLDSDRVRLHLDANGTGTVAIAEPHPPRVEGHPPAGPPPSINEGFLHYPQELEYSVEPASVVNGRLLLRFGEYEPFRSWCEAQTPQRDDLVTDDERYACTRSWPLDFSFISEDPDACRVLRPETGEGELVDCFEYLVCQNLCVCTADRCGIPEETQPFYVFYAAFEEPDILKASLTSTRDATGLNRGDSITIRLFRE